MTRVFGRLRQVFGLLAFFPACAGAEHSAAGPLREGHFPAAVLALRAREPELPSLPPRARAHYALQRGLGELGLGNARAADFWLTLAKRAAAADPGCFDATEHGQLLAAWRSLGRMPGETR